MTSLELARWQFGITTLYHFIFVPVTIGLALFVAYCQTRWYRSGEERWLRATSFWGKLMLISFALGVATGIVQEFQFGMNWSNYSRFVADIFGAPLAVEGLAAFFVESTFLGLWIFGWGRLSKVWGAFIGPGPRERVGGGLRRTVRRLARSSFLVPGGCGWSRRWFPRAWARARVGAAAFALAGVQGARDRGAAS
jgi:hypothetical protein